MTKSIKYKVLITTSGLGQRLGDLTKYTNKILVRVGKKPVISYIIESYDKDIEFVITIGHFASQVKDFIKIAYPNLKVTFVDVDKYQGEGSSLGYSMLKAKKHLQCPFIFHASDTIVTEKVPPPSINWNGGFKGTSSALYASFTINKNSVQQIYDKGAIDYDFLHIGLVGIKDYKSFWYYLESLYLGSLYANPQDTSLNDCQVISQMLVDGRQFAVKEFKGWFDIGNVDSLNEARQNLAEGFTNLDKPGESIFVFDKFVVKFYYDKQIVKERFQRAKLLKSLLPKMEDVVGNFYRYEYAKGDLYPRVVTTYDFKKFLNWCRNNLWIKKEIVNKKEFKQICKRFYLDKTKERIHEFLSLNRLKDNDEIINDENVPRMADLLKEVDFDLLSNADQYQFHGDLVLDNVIKTKRGYKLLDWRQNFGGLLEAGDRYYDLAKLNHNLTINHDLINSRSFKFSKVKDTVNLDILRSDNLISCQKELWDFVENEKLDKNKLLILTALIWINMSPLHLIPINFGLFLYYYGKLNLCRVLKNIE